MKYLLVFLFATTLSSAQAQENWLSEQFIDATVLLEKKVGDVFYPHGTGFLLYNYGDAVSHYTVVTCEHVLKNDHVYVTFRLNNEVADYFRKKKTTYITTPEKEEKYEIFGNKIRIRKDLTDSTSLVVNQHLDIGVFLIPKLLFTNDDNENILAFQSITIANSAIQKKSDTKVATDTYFIGFPDNLGTEFDNEFGDSIMNPIIRSGSIAYKSITNPFFLLDALSYPGNSGSPVFTKASPLKPRSYLIGMVTGHRNYPEQTESYIQTSPNQFHYIPGTAYTNMGLAKCVWIDEILPLVDKAINLKLRD